MRGLRGNACVEQRLATRGDRCRAIAMAIVAVLLLSLCVHAEESAVATIAVSASPAASYFGERLIEGVMDFRGSKYLLTLHGTSRPVSSVGLVFGLRRARDIIGPYTPTADGLRNLSGVTIRFDPPLTIRDGTLQIELASRIYPKVSTGQGGEIE